MIGLTGKESHVFRFMTGVWTLLLALGSAASAPGQAVPTYVGIRTFMGAPYVANLEELHADFAVLGVPFDEGTWGWPGERYGPRAMRESSQEYNHDLTEGFYYIDGDRTVGGCGRRSGYADGPFSNRRQDHGDGRKDSLEGSVPNRSGRRPQHHVRSLACRRCSRHGFAFRRSSGHVERGTWKPGSRLVGESRCTTA